jgi:hypothetical protein
MTSDKHDTQRPNQAQLREARLKAALKANMGRRKAQARARASGEDDKNRTDRATEK